MSRNFRKTREMNFENMSALFIYKYELEGQISDGKYENSRPTNHWEWVGDPNTKITVSKELPIGYTGWEHQIKTYNLNDWPTRIKKGEIWAERVYAYGRIGKIAEKLGMGFESFNYYDMALYENINYHMMHNPDLIPNYNSWKESLKGYLVDYFTKANVTEELFNEFMNTDYNLNELKKDLKSMKMTVNTYRGYEF